MPPPNNAASETSPLLPKGNDELSEAVEPSGGLLPNTISSAQRVNENEEQGIEDVPAGESSAQDGEEIHKGLPEVQKRMKYIFPALAIGVMLTAADQTIVVASYSAIGSDLGALNKSSWLATAFFLTLASFQPLSGKLSDIFGRKSCLLIAYTIFGVGCLGCGLSRTMEELIVWRAIAGIGGGAMNTLCSILLSDIVTLRDRGTWQGYINISYSVGAALGAPLGGIFADSAAGWRWSFLFQTPLCVVAIIAVGLTLKLPKTEDSQWKAKLRRIDWLGAAVLLGAIFALLLGLDRGSNDSWATKVCLIPLCLSFPLFALFFFVEKKVAAEPFAPGSIIFKRSLFAPFLCNFFSLGAYLATLFFVAQYMQIVSGYSAKISGVLLIPAVVASVLGSLFAGFYMKRTGKYYWLIVICYANLVVGILLIALFAGVAIKSDTGIVICTFIASFNNGIGVTASLIALLSNAPFKDQAVVTACSYLFRSLGGTTGISLSAAVANQVLRSTLGERLGGKDADKIVDAVRRDIKYVKTLNPEQRSIVRGCYMLASEAAFGFQVIFSLGAAISAWFLVQKILNRA